MTLLAIPSPSPITVTVNVPNDAALDTYTGVLALFTIGLAVIGAVALVLQRREIQHTAAQLKLTEDQLKLARDEFQAAQLAARPELHADVEPGDPSTEFGVIVNYVHGSQPAYDVEVVIRQSGLLFGGEVGVLAPMRPHSGHTFGPLPDHMDWPADVQQVPVADDEYQVALTWTRTDKKRVHMSWLVRADGRIEWVSGSRELRRQPARGE